jgi:hypothetical protein
VNQLSEFGLAFSNDDASTFLADGCQLNNTPQSVKEEEEEKRRKE